MDSHSKECFFGIVQSTRSSSRSLAFMFSFGSHISQSTFNGERKTHLTSRSSSPAFLVTLSDPVASSRETAPSSRSSGARRNLIPILEAHRSDRLLWYRLESQPILMMCELNK